MQLGCCNEIFVPLRNRALLPLVSVPTTTRPETDAALEAQQATGEAVPRVGEVPQPAERPGRRVRDWFGAAGSARSRILISYVVLLTLAAALGLLGFRQALLVRLDDVVDDAMGQEIRELQALRQDGIDPDTGKPFTSLDELFETYFDRNVPSRDEALIGFVDGEYYDSTELARFPLDRLPREMISYGESLASRSPADARSGVGRIDTALGEAHYRAYRIEKFRGDTGAFLVTILPRREREEIGDLLTYGGAATLAVLLLASACAWLIAGRVLKPVGLLADTARSISQSDLTHRVNVRGTGEAADMARSFNAMLDRLEAVFRSQREFVRDANHELRDPLTIIRGHLELMSMDDDPEERQRTIKIVLDELDRIGRIVGDLQLLAEADQPGFLDLEWIDAELFSHELVSKATALAARRWELDRAAVGTFFADRHRLTEAVLNLAHNAVQHTDAEDTIAIGASLNNDVVSIWVRDTGTGISVSDQEIIFNRFTRGTDAHRRYPGGGLGLALVKAIAEAHGGHVELDSRLGEGSTFTIVVPKQANQGAAEWPES
jgi:two-component system, OmpR family, sensor kinase